MSGGTGPTSPDVESPKLESPQVESPDVDYDVVVIGGAFTGSALACLLHRWVPESRILVVERQESFPRKVGEATVEVSSMFLHRALGLYDHLSREHLPKHGLRFWTTDGPGRKLAEMSEIGSFEMPQLPSFQLDRSTLDAELLERAEAAGCEVARPATVKSVEHDWPRSRVEIEDAEGGIRRVRTRWVIDASGRQAFLARRQRLLKRVEEHPTAAVWARWHGVADLDGVEVLGADPRSPCLPAAGAARRLATNHFTGYGWWCWMIPLSGGETSIGLVYDKRLFEPPGEGTLPERFERFLRAQPGLAELLAGAVMEEGDCTSYSHLPYKSSRYMDRGWALVGDAASFLDPFYSPGLDHASMSVWATARILEEDLRGRLDEAALPERIGRHNKAFLRAYDRWLDGLYLGKYEVLGDAELLAIAFLMDTSFYFFGVVTPVHRDLETLANPPFGVDLPQATVAWKMARGVNRRLRDLARIRRRIGIYGRRNAGWRPPSRAFRVGAEGVWALLRGLRLWLRVELSTFRWRVWHKLRPIEPEAIPAPRPAPTP